MFKRDITSKINDLVKEVDNYGKVNADEIKHLNLEGDWKKIADAIVELNKSSDNLSARQFLAEKLSKLFENFKLKVIYCVFYSINTKSISIHL